MTRVVYCQKLQKEAPGLPTLPLPGPIGQRIYENICKEAWDMWVAKQTIIINENHLSLIDPEAQRKLQFEMEQFLFDD